MPSPLYPYLVSIFAFDCLPIYCLSIAYLFGRDCASLCLPIYVCLSMSMSMSAYLCLCLCLCLCLPSVYLRLSSDYLVSSAMPR
jgi:hypothetical protein